MSLSLVYVGSSQATKADGLYVEDEFVTIEAPSENDPVAKELAILRPLISLHERGDFAGIQFMYHNVEGLSTHYEDVLADPCFMKSDIIMLAETGTLPADYFEFPGFVMAAVIHSNDDPRKPRKKCGVITYIRQGLSNLSRKTFSINQDRVQVLVCYILNNIRFVLVYASPQANDEQKGEVIAEALLQEDEDFKTVLVGDFNIDFNSEDGKDFMEGLQVLNLDLRTNPKHYTTRGGTTIDAIFSNKSMRTGVYISMYSYHMSLYGQID